MTDEDRLTHLRSRFEECSKSSFEWKYSVGGVLLALPLCFALKSNAPFLMLSVGGACADFYSTYKKCLPERNAIDLLLLKRKKLELQKQKEILQIQKDTWSQYVQIKRPE